MVWRHASGVPRDACREHDAVDFEPPAEPATDEVTVQADLLGLEAEGGELGHGAIAGLRPRPDLAYVLAPVEGAIHRLERGMREERLVIDGLVVVRRTCCALGGMALARGHDTALAHGSLELRDDRGLLHGGVRSVVPARRQRFHAL